PSIREGLMSPAMLRRLRRKMESLFVEPMADVFSIVAHRLLPGQGIGVHNDDPRGGSEAFRMVLHLGPELDDSSGGHLMFFRSRDPDDVACAFRPIHNTAVGFALSERSYHAVADVMAGIRYSIVYSFW